jgi:hypothetical protein
VMGTGARWEIYEVCATLHFAGNKYCNYKPLMKASWLVRKKTP